MFVASAAAIIGRLRSIPMAFVGGLFLGVAQNWVFSYAHFAKDIQGFNSSVPFVLLLVGLVLLARDRSRRGGSESEEAPPPDYLAALPRWRRALPWTIGVIFLVVYIMFLANSFWVGVMASGLAGHASSNSVATRKVGPRLYVVGDMVTGAHERFKSRANQRRHPTT